MSIDTRNLILEYKMTHNFNIKEYTIIILASRAKKGRTDA